MDMNELQQVINSIKTLPASDRAEMAKVLIESLDEERPHQPDIEEQWIARVEQRLSELEAGDTELVSWESIKGQLLNSSD